MLLTTFDVVVEEVVFNQVTEFHINLGVLQCSSIVVYILLQYVGILMWQNESHL